MSSHHVVRDKQEPALIIANGASCSNELLGQLLEWSPVVLVLDGAVDRVLELGIKIDILAGDFDRNRNPEAILAYQQVEIVALPDQNKTDLEKGIELLIERGHQSINVIWATGLRADHTLNNIALLPRYRDLADIVILDDYSRIFLLKRSYTKWYTKGTPLSLMPLGKVEGIETSGLKYNLKQESLELGYRTGSSNEALEDGQVHIKHQQGDLLLMECWD
ncbi:MAG: thiamine diphosphokinase [Bacteroidetes bacterium]|nr:thiamine diphosphokinase [Bacteroidota bacterium]MCK6612164.1 thiamine diphosphokinase [Bacteroidia bacterium]